jgi:lipopolysaccharide export system permease protein
MKKLDWYILLAFLKTFFFSVLLLTAIMVVIDLSEKTDDFVKADLSPGVILGYYVGFVPSMLALLFPLFVFISVIFFTSKMANRSEFISMLAAGMSLRRILRPYVIGGIFLSALLWLGNMFYIPRASEIRTNFEAKYVNTADFNVRTGSIYMRVDSFTYCGIRYYDTASKSGGSFFLETVHDYQVVYNLRADNILWDTAKKNWKLTGVVERKIDGLKEDVSYVQQVNRNFNFKPSDLQRDEFVKNRLTWPELNRTIQLEKLRGSEIVKELQMEKAKRSATPVSVLILTLIGAILACRRIRGGSGVHLAAGIIICALFILSDRFSTIFSTKGNLNPLIAAWIPNIIFGSLCVYLYRQAPK